MISWFSRKQSNIALSTTEAEYIATRSASCEAVWLRKLLSGLFGLELEATVIMCDNQSCIKMTENPVFHDKSKNIEIQYFYIWDLVQKGVVKLEYVGTNEQVANVLTKPLSRVKFEYFRDKRGVVQKDIPWKGEQCWWYLRYHDHSGFSRGLITTEENCGPLEQSWTAALARRTP